MFLKQPSSTLYCRHLNDELVTAAGAEGDPEGAVGEAAQAAAGVGVPAAVQTVVGSTGQGLRALALHNCSCLTLADLGALTGSCPHLQMLLLGGSGLHVPAEVTDRHVYLTAARIDQCWSLYQLHGGPTGDMIQETMQSAWCMQSASCMHRPNQGQNTVSFLLQATHLALVFAGLCLRLLAWQILLPLQWSWAQGPAASAPHGRGLRW